MSDRLGPLTDFIPPQTPMLVVRRSVMETNLAAMQGILGECFARASQRQPKQAALRDAFSCYYSGNFVTGHQHGYVGKVLAAWNSRSQPPGRGAGIVLSQAGLSPATFTSNHPGVSP